MFSDNYAGNGGVISIDNYGSISFKDNSTTTFTDNTAAQGAAIFSAIDNLISFEGNSKVFFNNNIAESFGGTIVCYSLGSYIFGGHSLVIFNGNAAYIGGAVHASSCKFTFNYGS